MRRTPFVLAAVLSVALLGGCGSDDEPEVSSEASTVATVGSSAQGEDGGDPSAGLTSVLADVRKIAPRLEGLYRNKEYPRELDDVIASLDGAQLELAEGNSLGGYRYDERAVEFVLCVENSSGAFATYDTAPMATGERGEDGGCPTL